MSERLNGHAMKARKFFVVSVSWSTSGPITTLPNAPYSKHRHRFRESICLNQTPDVIYNVIEIVLRAEFDVFAFFVTPCGMPGRRAPRVTNSGNLFLTVFIAEMQCAFEEVAPNRAIGTNRLGAPSGLV
jgi:hypothetical protein